jgi:hypothetical protein
MLIIKVVQKVLKIQYAENKRFNKKKSKKIKKLLRNTKNALYLQK